MFDKKTKKQKKTYPTFREMFVRADVKNWKRARAFISFQIRLINECVLQIRQRLARADPAAPQDSGRPELTRGSGFRVLEPRRGDADADVMRSDSDGGER